MRLVRPLATARTGALLATCLLVSTWGTVLAQSALDLIATADPEAGRMVAHTCAACHSFEAGGEHGIGPNLWGIVGAPKASQPEFSYSAALAAVGGVWDYESLDRFLAGPQAYIPGTNMPIAGIDDELARAQVIAYLRTLADEPPPLPATEVAATAVTRTGDLGGLPAGEGRALVYYSCSACHSLNLVKQQRLSRKRWEKTLQWMVEEQGMNELPAGEQEQILDYLAAHYGAE